MEEQETPFRPFRGEGHDRKDQVNLCLQLAERAAQRYESLRNVEWKANYGLWFVFVAGSAALITADTLIISPCVFCLGLFFAVLILLVYLMWLRYLHTVHRRDNQCSYWWECVARIAAGEQEKDTLPKELSPPSDWPRPHPFNAKPEGKNQGKNRCLKKLAESLGLHVAHLLWFIVMFALALLFVTALWIRLN